MDQQPVRLRPGVSGCALEGLTRPGPNAVSPGLASVASRVTGSDKVADADRGVDGPAVDGEALHPMRHHIGHGDPGQRRAVRQVERAPVPVVEDCVPAPALPSSSDDARPVRACCPLCTVVDNHEPQTPAATMARMRTTIAYVDGHNFYHGAVKRRPDCKWLDFRALCQDLVPDGYEVSIVRYYTARVKNRPEDPVRARGRTSTSERSTRTASRLSTACSGPARSGCPLSTAGT